MTLLQNQTLEGAVPAMPVTRTRRSVMEDLNAHFALKEAFSVRISLLRRTEVARMRQE